MQYTCPDCGSGGGDHEKEIRVNLYWCHVCKYKVKMLPSRNGEIFSKLLVKQMIEQQMIEGLKILNNYIDDGPRCGKCLQVTRDEVDDQTLTCVRNVDFPFNVENHGYCDKWEKREILNKGENV